MSRLCCIDGWLDSLVFDHLGIDDLGAWAMDPMLNPSAAIRANGGSPFHFTVPRDQTL
jgi:hypothetical protein